MCSPESPPPPVFTIPKASQVFCYIASIHIICILSTPDFKKETVFFTFYPSFCKKAAPENPEPQLLLGKERAVIREDIAACFDKKCQQILYSQQLLFFAFYIDHNMALMQHD